MSKTLYEALGGLVRQQKAGGIVIPPKAPIPGNNPIINHQLQGVELVDFSFRGWQLEVLNNLRKNNNIYVISAPGSGKTSPVMFYWAEKLLNVNPNLFIRNARTSQVDLNILFNRLQNIFTDPQSLPKILYLCPVRQLVYEVQREFTEYFSKILLHFIKISFVNQTDTAQILGRTTNIYNILETTLNVNLIQHRQQITQITSQININKRNNNPSLTNKLIGDLQVVQSELLKTIGDGLKKFISQKLVHIKTDVNPKPNSNAPVTITIYESGLNLYNTLNKEDLRLLVIDESHLLQNLPDDNNDRLENIVTSIYSTLLNFHKGSKKQLVLLSGTVQPRSASELITYIRKCLKINIVELQSSDVARNPSNISVVPMDSLLDDNTLVKLMLNPDSNNNLIILFSKSKIDKLVDLALSKSKGNMLTASQIDRGELEDSKQQSYNIDLDNIDRKHNYTHGPKVRAKFDVSKHTKDLISQINKLPGAADISDERLLLCVLSGFGIIYNMDDLHDSKIGKQNAGRDQQIIANLFSQGKIKTVLATDAVGIGVNLKIKNMYVPNITKFDGFKNSKLYISNASQLYNRVGRMAFDISTIYTPEGNVSEIIQALSATNEKFDARDTIIKNLCNKKEGFMIAWKRFTNRFRRP